MLYMHYNRNNRLKQAKIQYEVVQHNFNTAKLWLELLNFYENKISILVK